MLEEYLVEHLPLVSRIDTFGCELTLLDADTHLALQDPIQEDLVWNTQVCLIVHECFLIVERKEQRQGLEYEDCPKAIRVPANDSGILEAKAFFSTARVRHVKVDTRCFWLVLVVLFVLCFVLLPGSYLPSIPI